MADCCEHFFCPKVQCWFSAAGYYLQIGTCALGQVQMQDLGFEPPRVCVLNKFSIGFTVRLADQVGTCDSEGFSAGLVGQNTC